MRILLLAQFLPPDFGGQERHVLNLADVLAGRGHHVAIASQWLRGAPELEVLSSGVRIHRFRTSSRRLPGLYTLADRPHHPPYPDPLALRALARVVRQERPDVVHAHNWIVNSAVALHRGRAGHRRYGLVLTLHDYSQVCPTKRLLNAGETCEGPSPARCLRCAGQQYGPVAGAVAAVSTGVMRPLKYHAVDHVISVSRAVEIGNGVAAAKVPHSVIPNFVPDQLFDVDLRADSAEPAGLPAGDYLLFVGELSAAKGVPVLLRAFEVIPSGPPLLLVGQRTAQTPRDLPPGAHLGIEWPHERIIRAFRHATVAVLPSTWPDPCPTTVIEAMACGRPVVTTRNGGMTDLIEDGVNGILVTPGDSVELAAAVRRLLGDPQLRDRIGRAARRRARQFSASTVAAQLERVYAEVAPWGLQRPVVDLREPAVLDR